MNIGNITSNNSNLDYNGKVMQIEVYEQLIEQLQQENQLLKKKYENAVADYETTMAEKEQLKKQVENYKKLGFKHLQDKNNNLETQQKEFISYLESEIDRLEKTEFYIDSIQKAAIETHKHNLSKYKEIIGESDDKK